MSQHSLSPVQVRAASPQDFAAAGVVVVDAYRHSGQLDGDTGYDAVLRDVAGRAEHSQVLVAERDGVLVGTVTVTEPGSLYSEVATDGELEFRFLGVALSAWGSGVASALVRECLAIADRRGLDTAICTRDTNDRALQLYQRLGFERVPERDWDPLPGVLLQVLVRPYPG